MHKITVSPSLLRGFLLLTCMSVLVMMNAWLPVSGRGKWQERTVSKFRNGKLPMPLEIKAIKTKKGMTKIGEAISEDDDWFDGLTVSLENTSGKTIIYIGGGFLFPKPKEGGIVKPSRYEQFMYGRHPAAPSAALLTNLPISVKPGEMFDITLPHSDYASIKQRLKELDYPDSITDIKFNVEEIYYDDGTAWIVGGEHERDPDNPES
jgi:hypothetical protein